MRTDRVAGVLIPCSLSIFLIAAPLAADPIVADFDQGVDVSDMLRTIHRDMREDRDASPPVGPATIVPPADVSFETGNAFSAVILDGYISVSCSEGGRHDSASFRCREEVLDPAEFVRFVGPKGLDADKVTLEATWENGRTRKKTKGYDSASGKSTSRFNLWIATLFQRPLLDYGKNVVRYFMKKDGDTVMEGSFTAEVRTGEERACRYRRHYFSSDLSDCRAGTTRMCDRYFRDENYCQ
ncbi:hypothetical protein ACFL2T_05420 [Elusimicrobiota bacterium]